VTTTRRLVVEPGEPGDPPHVRAEKIVRWQLVGAADPEPTAEEIRDDLMFALRDSGHGPEPIYSTDDDGEHLDWPDLATWVVDADYARVLALASLPLGREVPELDTQPEPDPEHEEAVELQAFEDRQDWALVAAMVEAAARRLPAIRRMRRSRALASAPKAKPSPPSSPRVFFETKNGTDWTRFVPGPRLRARARVRTGRSRK
jgi:hypothetical protein